MSSPTYLPTSVTRFGYLRKSLLQILLQKQSKYFGTFWAFLKNPHLKVKTAVPTFWATFGEIWLLFILYLVTLSPYLFRSCCQIKKIVFLLIILRFWCKNCFETRRFKLSKRRCCCCCCCCRCCCCYIQFRGFLERLQSYRPNSICPDRQGILLI